MPTWNHVLPYTEEVVEGFLRDRGLPCLPVRPGNRLPSAG